MAAVKGRVQIPSDHFTAVVITTRVMVSILHVLLILLPT